MTNEHKQSAHFFTFKIPQKGFNPLAGHVRYPWPGLFAVVICRVDFYLSSLFLQNTHWQDLFGIWTGERELHWCLYWALYFVIRSILVTGTEQFFAFFFFLAHMTTTMYSMTIFTTLYLFVNIKNVILYICLCPSFCLFVPVFVGVCTQMLSFLKEKPC